MINTQFWVWSILRIRTIFEELLKNVDNEYLCPGSGAVALAHLDGSEMDEAVCTMIRRVQELALGYPEGRLELQLVGGFSDEHHYSEELFYSIMSKWQW